MPSVPTESASKAGIISTETGERHIPSSQRPDGSTRKEIKIRPGYKPPEDVEVYKNRTAEAWKTRGSGGIPGAATLDDGATTAESKASNKNAKRREARKKAKSAGEGGVDAENPATPGMDESVAKDENVKTVAASSQSAPKPAADPEVEKEREAKKLQKKLRQARELKEKKESGESLLPEQFEKVIRINELIRQLDTLGFDAEGEKKDPSS